ncbi:stage II sporulation protein E [Cohnella sp. CFH 77786]|uniref:stage II sporulation protein E n=1 Tax=Cohnella sp. CFH 77786 TaxID=2662265 RepID=UPI001C60DEA8|nr:stage II sporulation protein E [Cohnella sp. CFH 77786]MBW5449025.1 stage II sporulation protein E [Cohnella sp. CFH 77786]
MDKSTVVPFIPRPGGDEPQGSEAKEGWWARRRKRRSPGAPPGAFVRAGQALRERKWMLLTIVMGFLLGRAELLENIAPFAAAFFGVVLYVRRDMAFWAAVSLIAGSFWAAEPAPAVIIAEIGVLYLLYRGLEVYEKADLSHAPVVVFAATLLVRLFDTVLSDKPAWLPYVWTTVEAGLAFVLTMLFLHALPLLNRTKKSVQLRQEEWIGVLILAACLLTGMTGWSVYGMEITDVLTRYVVLIAAFVGGVSLGTSAGVVAGMMLTLSNLSAAGDIGLLAFGGLMAGLIREGGKAATVFGLLLGTSVLSLFASDAAQTMMSAWAAVAAAILLFFTPRTATDAISSYVPGTPHYARNQRDYAQKVRDLTAERVARFSEVFRQLSGSFRQMTDAGETVRQDKQFDHFAGAVHEKACASCHRRGLCWDTQFFQTYKLVTDMMGAVADNPNLQPGEMPKSWSRLCVKTPQVLDILKREYDLYRHDLHWRRQLQDSRYLVADQLSGVSQVMDDLVKEIRREAQQMERQEAQIREAVDRLGLAVQSIDIISLEEGRIEIELVHAFRTGYDECRKMIAPLLSEILGETVSVRQERSGEPAAHLTTVVFASAKAYEVETGVAGAAKDGDLLSGDSFTITELGNGKFAVALSDGMGNGARAKMESSAALSMLEQLLQSGIDERLAVKSVNSVLLLRSPDEMFATIDLALIDLYSAHATMLKIGSTPSFIKRGRNIIPIAANNLPIGILQEIEIDLLRVQLLPGDTLIMMTDGILDAPGHAINKEVWIKRVLSEIETDDPQELADELLDIALKQNPGGIRDDMTVVVSRITRYQPEWAAFRFPGLGRVERPRTVS